MLILRSLSGIRVTILTVTLLLLSLLPASLAVIAQETIKVAYAHQVHDAALLAAEKELGGKYQLEFIKFLRYADVEVALSRGDVQIASLGYTNAVMASLREASPSYKFVSGMSRGAINVVCNKDVKVEKWDDLKGKKFGLLAGGTAEVFFDDAISRHGVSRKDIPTVTFTAPGPPLLQALQNKDIDCTAVYEPFAATAVARGISYYPSSIDLADNSFRGVNGAVAVNTEFLKNHAAFVDDLVGEVVKATAYYNSNKDKLQTDFTKRLEFDPGVIKIAADKVILDSNLYFASVIKAAEAMRRLGFIKGAPDTNRLAGYYDYSFLTKVTGKSADASGRAE
jgi:ABC-type nitrate/sulfonate/bicarbonate transport system substrate-binding protein